MSDDPLKDAYWTLHRCRESIRDIGGAMAGAGKYGAYSAAFSAVNAAMEAIPDGDFMLVLGVTMRRCETVFWLENSCPHCGHSAPMVYKPDLLNGPEAFECHSKHNPMRVNYPCSGKWDVAATDEEKRNVRELLNVAEEQESLYKKIDRNRKRLGYT